MQCNIDARGKAVRLVWGLLMIAAALVLAALWLLSALTGGWWLTAILALAAFGGLAVFEARAGWCIVRAMGFKTPL